MRCLCIVLFSLFFSFSFADTVIQMEEYGGVYRVPCTVNGAKMKFIFDTGATNVCLSLSMAEYLLDNGYIEKTDILGSGTTTVADGRIIDHVKLILKDIQIGDFHIRNVESIVVEGQNAPLLFGQSAIKKLGNYEIQGNLLIIHNGNDLSNEEFIYELHKKLSKSMVEARYDQALNFFEQLYLMNQLSNFEKFSYAQILYINKESSKAIPILDSIEDRNELISDGIDIYRLYADIYFSLDDLDKAIFYVDLSNKQMNHTEVEFANNFCFLADCYKFKEFYKLASEWYWKAFCAYALSFGIEPDYLWKDCKNGLKKNQKSWRNDEIDYIAYYYLFCSERSGGWSTAGFLEEVEAFARANNRYAQKLLNDMGFNAY